jgi:hypothetical protein
MGQAFDDFTAERQDARKVERGDCWTPTVNAREICRAGELGHDSPIHTDMEHRGRRGVLHEINYVGGNSSKFTLETLSTLATIEAVYQELTS